MRDSLHYRIGLTHQETSVETGCVKKKQHWGDRLHGLGWITQREDKVFGRKEKVARTLGTTRCRLGSRPAYPQGASPAMANSEWQQVKTKYRGEALYCKHSVVEMSGGFLSRRKREMQRQKMGKEEKADPMFNFSNGLAPSTVEPALALALALINGPEIVRRIIWSGSSSLVPWFVMIFGGGDRDLHQRHFPAAAKSFNPPIDLCDSREGLVTGDWRIGML